MSLLPAQLCHLPSPSPLHRPPNPLLTFTFLHQSSKSTSLRFPRIEARGITRKESAKVRNRRFQRNFSGSATKTRLSVFCSERQLYAMLVDDQNEKTLFYASTLQKSIREDPSSSTTIVLSSLFSVILTCLQRYKNWPGISASTSNHDFPR